MFYSTDQNIVGGAH